MNRLLNYAEICLGLMILTLPLTLLPERYKLPVLGGSLPHILLLFSLLFFVAYVFQKRRMEIQGKKYFAGFFLWSLFCLAWGCWKFPFYDAATDEFLRHSKMVMLTAEFFPVLQDNAALLHGKMFLSYFWYMLKEFFFPFAGMFFIIAGLFRVGKADELYKYLLRAVYGLSILMMLYSIPEVIWLWTGNETCARILSSVNVHLYDPVLYNGWWPPLLWAGQLRSFCLEPSYFGIITSFLLPLLVIDTRKQIRPWKILLIFVMVFMIFMTKARTATVIYLGESIVFFFLIFLCRYPGWKKILLAWAAITIGAFSVYLAGPSMLCSGENTDVAPKKQIDKTVPHIKNYVDENVVSVKKQIDKTVPHIENYVDENVVSVVRKDKRSNSARFGNTVAFIKIGMDYPLTGVGRGLHSPYMKDRIPDFARDNHEIQNWIKDMQEKTFLESGLPVLNEYAAVFAWNGLPGLVFFLIPPFIVVRKGITDGRKKKSFEIIGLLTALAGQMACMLSSGMFLTYPLTLWLVYCILEKKEKEWTGS